MAMSCSSRWTSVCPLIRVFTWLMTLGSSQIRLSPLPLSSLLNQIASLRGSSKREVMQTSIEALSNVARAFVHLDYSTSNPQAHLSKDEQEELHARSLGWEARVGSH